MVNGKRYFQCRLQRWHLSIKAVPLRKKYFNESNSLMQARVYAHYALNTWFCCSRETFTHLIMSYVAVHIKISRNHDLPFSTILLFMRKLTALDQCLYRWSSQTCYYYAISRTRCLNSNLLHSLLINGRKGATKVYKKSNLHELNLIKMLTIDFI